MSVDISPEAAERAAIMLEGMPEVDLIGRDGLGDEITVSAMLRALRSALTAKEAELAEMKAALADTIRKDLDALNERCDEIDALKSQLTEAGGTIKHSHQEKKDKSV